MSSTLTLTLTWSLTIYPMTLSVTLWCLWTFASFGSWNLIFSGWVLPSILPFPVSIKQLRHLAVAVRWRCCWWSTACPWRVRDSPRIDGACLRYLTIVFINTPILFSRCYLSISIYTVRFLSLAHRNSPKTNLTHDLSLSFYSSYTVVCCRCSLGTLINHILLIIRILQYIFTTFPMAEYLRPV